MSETIETERNDVREDGRRPPRAVVGSHRVEEEIFGQKGNDGRLCCQFKMLCQPETATRTVACSVSTDHSLYRGFVIQAQEDYFRRACVR